MLKVVGLDLQLVLNSEGWSVQCLVVLMDDNWVHLLVVQKVDLMVHMLAVGMADKMVDRLVG